MAPASSRRQFLETARAGLAVGTGISLASSCVAEMQPAGSAKNMRPRIAALASTYFYLSHAYHIVGRFLDGFTVYASEDNGNPQHHPAFEVSSLFIEQAAGPSDLGRPKAERHGVRLSPTITDA